jgi:prepilin-type N-terminal cleavage/methylation domain-containing protein
LEALMKKCKAFTLVELLVVIGIIALLAGILLPAVNLMRKRAMITSEKADFQSIATALEQYKTDFGDYPRNVNLPTWKMLATGTPTAAPIYYSLAASLLGPGPAVTETVGSNLEIGDGSDGPGFRSQTTGAIPGTVNVTTGGTSVTVSVNSQYAAQAQAFASNFVPPSSPTSPSPTPASITFLPNLLASPPTPYGEAIGITSVTFSPGTPPSTPPKLMLTLASPGPGAAHNGSCLVTQLSGKVWGPYISADTFKVAFIPNQDVNTTAITSLVGYGQPVLLDRWGQVIQYFPAYGSVSNRANDSVTFKSYTPAQLATISVGPLYGYSQPWSLEGKSSSSLAQNAIWDLRDGAPFYTAGAGSSPAFCQQWQDVTSPSGNTSTYFHPGWALQWMLGDQPNPANTSPPLDDVITGSEKVATPGPYILISAGPDGPSRANGGFCNMADRVSGNPLPANTWQQTFTDSGNIYNFDRQ